jgi:condensin complex subunit 3
MALSSFQLFIGQASEENEDIQLKAIEAIFDVLITYEQDLLKRSDNMV